MKQKNSGIMCVLSFCFHPLSYIYIGWRYVISFAVFAILYGLIATSLLSGILERIPLLFSYGISCFVSAFIAFKFTRLRNNLIEDTDVNHDDLVEMKKSLAYLIGETLIASCMYMLVFNGIFACIIESIVLFTHNSILKGILFLFPGIPLIILMIFLILEYTYIPHLLSSLLGIWCAEKEVSNLEPRVKSP